MGRNGLLRWDGIGRTGMARRHDIIGKTERWDDRMGDGMAWERRVERPRSTQEWSVLLFNGGH